MINFIHAVSFFETSTGYHIGSTALPFKERSVEPKLNGKDGYTYYLLWSKKNDGVFSLGGGDAFFVSVNGTVSYTIMIAYRNMQCPPEVTLFRITARNWCLK